MDNDFFHKLPQKRRDQLGGPDILLYNFQNILDIDRLRLSGMHNRWQSFYGLLPFRALLFAALGQPMTTALSSLNAP